MPHKEDLQSFLERINHSAEKLKTLDKATVCTHHDCDGITSGSIVAKALLRQGTKVDTITLKQLYSDDIDYLKKLDSWIVFTDFGSGYLPDLLNALGKNFTVIDHHQKGIGDFEYHINPKQFGLDGDTHISAAGIAYLVSKEMNPKNWDLSALGIVGAIGDMQDSRFQKLEGMNHSILEEGVKDGMLEVKNDLRLYGRMSRPLTQYLMFSTNPVLPDLTANKDHCFSFLNGLGLELQTKEGYWRTYEDLDKSEKKNLVTALIMHLNEHNSPEWKIKELFGEVYTLLKEEEKTPLRDAKEYSTLLNACGRHGKSKIGIQVCMGDREEYYEKALGMLQEHRRQLAQGITLMQEKGLEEFDHFYFFDAKKDIKDSIVGIVAGMLYGSGVVKTDKPIVAFSRHDDGSIKVSARATTELVRKGINLGLGLRETCQALGQKAEGGGHKIAAGCRLDENQKDSFLKKFDEKLGEQLRS